MTNGQRTITTAICFGAIATVIFGAGFVASDVLSTRRLTVTNDAGKAVVVATADAAGNGELVVFDSDGKQIFAVRGGKVYDAPTGTPAATRPPDAASAGRIIQLIRIEALPPEPGVRERVAELHPVAARLEGSARSADGHRANLGPTTNDNKAQKAHYRKIALGFRQGAQRLRAEATRLERDLETSKQEIYGWNGARYVILRTDRDLSRALTRINSNGFLKWAGRLTGLDDDTEIYSVSNVEPASRPAGFVDRP